MYDSLEIRICKETNSTLKSKDKDKNKIYEIEKFPCGIILILAFEAIPTISTA